MWLLGGLCAWLGWHSSSGQRSWPVPWRAGDLAARSLQSQSDLYSRSRSRGEIATVSARSRAASALINSRHRLAHRLRHRHTGARGDTGRGCRRGPRRRDGRRRRRLNGARRVLDETHSFFMRRLSADYLGGTSCQRVRCPIRGLVEIEPIFHTVFASVYHYAISELCQGLYHRNGV